MKTNLCSGHPGAPVLASSGIETIIRLWHPLPENSTKESRNIQVNIKTFIKEGFISPPPFFLNVFFRN